jgi:hypothetical protein
MCKDSAIAFWVCGVVRSRLVVVLGVRSHFILSGLFESAITQMNEVLSGLVWSAIAFLGKLQGWRSRHHDNNLNPLLSANFRSNVTVLLQPSCCAIAPIK